MRQDLAYKMDQAIASDDAASVRALLADEPRLTGTPIPVPRDWGEEMWLGVHRAAAIGLVDLVGQFLDAGASVDSRTRFRTPLHARATPLLLAAGQGHEPVVRLLLERGADPVLLDANHRSALSHAAARGHVPIADLLLGQGVPVDPVDDQQRTPLHWAIAGGHARLAIALIDAGADVNHQCPKEPAGFTPLHRCASVGSAMDAVSDRLRQAGADQTLRDPRQSKTADELKA